MGLFKKTDSGLFGGALKKAANKLVGTGIIASAASYIPIVGPVISTGMTIANKAMGANSGGDSSTATVPISNVVTDKALPSVSGSGVVDKSIKFKGSKSTFLILGGLVVSYFLLKK